MNRNSDRLSTVREKSMESCKMMSDLRYCHATESGWEKRLLLCPKQKIFECEVRDVRLQIFDICLQCIIADRGFSQHAQERVLLVKNVRRESGLARIGVIVKRIENSQKCDLLIGPHELGRNFVGENTAERPAANVVRPRRLNEPNHSH